MFTTITLFFRVLVSLGIFCTSSRAQIDSGAGSSVERTTLIVAPVSSATSSSRSVFTPNSPSSSFDSLGTGSTTMKLGPGPVTEPNYPPTITTCFIPATGTISTQQPLDASASLGSLPAGAECIAIIRSSGAVYEDAIFTVDADGRTSSFTSAVATSAVSSSSSGSSMANGAIVGAVLGSVFGSLFIGATVLWIRKQRRSSRASGTWFNRSAEWVQNEKRLSDSQFEMTRRDRV